MAAVVFVIFSYVLFASAGRFTFKKDNTSPYADQAEGFRRGQLSLATEPPELLATLYDPYKWDLREAVNVGYIWDASYFNGRYYLYFTPLPILLGYLPLRQIRGDYPPDSLIGVVLCTWAFLMSVAFVRRAMARDGRPPMIPLPVWILVMGFGGVLPFQLTDTRVYEVAIMTGMAMTATWAYSLLRFTEKPTPRNAMWMGLWLALSIAARPNLGVLLVIAAIAVYRSTERASLRRTIIAAGVPLFIVGSAVAAYNYARFGNPFEFGVKYQLTWVPMRDYRVCGLCTPGEIGRFFNAIIHYVFWPPNVRSKFPFVDLQGNRMDNAVGFPGTPEHMGGIGSLVPLTLIATLFALILWLARKRHPIPAGTRASIHVLAAAWLVLLGLSACWWVVSRYALDFMLLMTTATVLCVESGLVFLATAGVSLRPLRALLIALAVYSIVVGFLLGFMGPWAAFELRNPEGFRLISGAGPAPRAPSP